jgi:hypothetical protein
MKKLILFFLFSTLVPFVSADELKIKGYIKPDPLRGGNNYLIYNKRWKSNRKDCP